MAGHLGFNKIYSRILNHFYWGHLRKDVFELCNCCHVCQKVGKPNQTIPVALLKPIPVCSEPIIQVIIDCVSPLPKTSSGNQYLLTIMCRFTHFPKTIPLWNTNALRIAESLVKLFIFFGLPSLIQSDQGSNFMSSLIQQVMHQWWTCSEKFKFSYSKIKLWYDKKAKLCKFKVGDKVFVLLTLQNHAL